MKTTIVRFAQVSLARLLMRRPVYYCNFRYSQLTSFGAAEFESSSEGALTSEDESL